MVLGVLSGLFVPRKNSRKSLETICGSSLQETMGKSDGVLVEGTHARFRSFCTGKKFETIVGVMA